MAAAPWPVRSSTTRRRERGLPPAAWPPPRYGHTATLLPDGRVLVVGGRNASGYLAGAELYDGAAGAWSSTGDLASARYDHTATLLPDGRVLAVGGRQAWDATHYLTSAELYDPAANGGAGTWSATGSLTTARAYHTATLLPDGRVLVVGGKGNGDAPLASAEVYDPTANTWRATGGLAFARYDHTATLLADGRVLVVGGTGAGGSLASAELYDPATGAWRAAATIAGARALHTATLLPGGKVLVAGGATAAAPWPVRSCTIRRRVRGAPPVLSPAAAAITRRRCCPTARC